MKVPGPLQSFSFTPLPLYPPNVSFGKRTLGGRRRAEAGGRVGPELQQIRITNQKSRRQRVLCREMLTFGKAKFLLLVIGIKRRFYPKTNG